MNLKFHRGFTLIEMVVTMMVIGIITATSVVGLKKYKSRSYFEESVSQIYGEVLKAQSLSMSPGQEKINSYTLTVKDTGEYSIVENAESGSSKTIDSGKPGGVSLPGCLEPNFCNFKFNTNGTVETTNPIEITDPTPGSTFAPKIITVLETGSVGIE